MKIKGKIPLKKESLARVNGITAEFMARRARLREIDRLGALLRTPERIQARDALHGKKTNLRDFARRAQARIKQLGRRGQEPDSPMAQAPNAIQIHAPDPTRSCRQAVTGIAPPFLSQEFTVTDLGGDSTEFHHSAFDNATGKLGITIELDDVYELGHMGTDSMVCGRHVFHAIPVQPFNSIVSWDVDIHTDLLFASAATLGGNGSAACVIWQSINGVDLPDPVSAVLANQSEGGQPTDTRRMAGSFRIPANALGIVDVIVMYGVESLDGLSLVQGSSLIHVADCGLPGIHFAQVRLG